MDFVLWKPSDAGQPGWESPWGRGRPGWHIECSAMAYELLGPSFDIHGGGIDLVFPHHENEAAQSRCAHPDGTFANIWMHNGFLNVEGEKMSKSLGNFFTVRDLLDRGVPGEVMRFVLLSSHYRQPMDYSEARAEEASRTLRKWREIVSSARPAGSVAPEVLAALGDDLNTPLAMEGLHRLAEAGDSAALRASADVLGLLRDELDWTFAPERQFEIELERLIEAREKFRKEKNFEWADKIRHKLKDNAIEIMDTSGGVTWKIDDGKLRLNYGTHLYGVEPGVFPASWSTGELNQFLHTRVAGILAELGQDLKRRGLV
jgi:cysteinyl-tRNA synthetase